MADIIAQGLARGWDVKSAHTLAENSVLEADVAIVGTGAGGATTAEFLSAAGLKVLLLEEGRFQYQKDFRMNELDAFSTLYQEGTARKTMDGGIAIYQGRSVGGSTTVNWTSTFRPPEQTLAHWQSVHGVKGLSANELDPWFADREQALHMQPWLVAPNNNNSLLKQGCDKLGWSSGTMIRNVKDCWNIGYCGFGCPTNAKQSMLLTSIPKALDAGAQLVSGIRADHLLFNQDKAQELVCTALDEQSRFSTGRRVRVRARHFVMAAGAIGSPGILLRSRTPDPYDTLGKRTFLHPVNTCTATMPEPVEGYKGAPQSIYSDHFLWRDGVAGEVGFKLEVAPVFPGGLAAQEALHGAPLAKRLEDLRFTNSTIALLRDGFHEDSPGGSVKIRDDGSPALDYPITDYLWRGLKEAYLTLAEVQFAAGAKTVTPVHHDGQITKSWKEAAAHIQNLPMETLRAGLFSAHVMGGCSMGEDPERSVVNSLGEHHQVANLSVIDGSTFPTSIGANPQLSIYGVAAKQASLLAEKLTGQAPV